MPCVGNRCLGGLGFRVVWVQPGPGRYLPGQRIPVRRGQAAFATLPRALEFATAIVAESGFRTRVYSPAGLVLFQAGDSVLFRWEW